MSEPSIHPMTQKVRDNLWDNPPVPKSSLTPEQLQHYEKSGEWMYGGMDFDTLENSSKEAIAYIVEQLKSGLHPSYLSGDERNVMREVLGPDWDKPYI
jgi:hypothetical protein